MADRHETNKFKRLVFFNRFFRSEVSGSVLLLICTVVALAWANSPWAESYHHLAHTKVGVSFGDHTFKLSLQHWVNDLLMVLFFFVVGLEIKREILVGHLSSPRQAILPVTAAIGGMIIPAAVYVIFNSSGDGARGWGIPMATDIAFAIGILSLLSRAPIGLKVFLTALAIADDLGAILVIALFYTDRIIWEALGVSAFFLFLIFIASKLGFRRPGIYIGLALCVWVSVFLSGIHATVAGILVAMLVPIRSRIEPGVFLARLSEGLNYFQRTELTKESMISNHTHLDVVEDLNCATGEMRPPGLSLEHHLHPVQAFFVLPMFALFNAGVTLDSSTLSFPPTTVVLGVVAGLLIGKQVGITLFSWIAIRFGGAVMPEGVNWLQIYGASCLAGVGFTMSLFVSELAFDDPGILSEAKVGVLIASLISGIWGYIILRSALGKEGE